MKDFKGFALGLVLGLGLAVSSIGFAQNTTQNQPKKEADSCCAMACCKGDSKGQAMKNGGSCCGGDSCDIRSKT